ncbi:hypothetical protein DV738_g1898, partial [Chaetothyriales sp. CBS 135597]
MPISIKQFRRFVDGIPWARVYKKAETATKGQRIYPSKSNDKKANFRIDKGAKISENEHELVLQANKDAENAEVKKSAQKDSHKILAKCVIDPQNVDEQKANLQSNTAPDPSLLARAKHALLQQNALIPTRSTPLPTLLAARSILEAGAQLSIRARDPQSFVRYYSQLQPFYDYAELQKHQPSQSRSKITGLYLLLLLSQGDYAGFHTLLESLIVSEGQGESTATATTTTVESDPYIKYPIEIERSLMEGSYDQVWRKTSGRDVPGDEFALFSEILINTIRLEIASCAARSYPSLPITSAKNLLFLDSEGAVSQFARDQGWELRDGRIYFPIVLEDGKSKDGDAALERELVSHVVGYARELETIV